MIRHIRHFATRLRRGGSAAPITATQTRTAQSAAWVRFDQWLRHQPLRDIDALRKRELIHEHARVAVALVGQAGAAVVMRIGSARNTRSLQNEDGALHARVRVRSW
ncbi:MAG: hypothetical protein U0163_16000 [Gemmatimonadaceae bacterium]